MLSYRHHPEDEHIIDPLTPELRTGLITIATLALASFLSTFGLLTFLTYRMVKWRQSGRSKGAYNQCVILIYNLLLADLQQSIAFLLNFHWVRLGAVWSFTPTCYAQGWFVSMGDMSSGIWVLAIAVHTFFTVIKRTQVPHKRFVFGLVGIWLFCLAFSLAGPIAHGRYLYAKAGPWVRHRHRSLFIVLKRRVKTIDTVSHSKSRHRIHRIARYMVLYPITYVILSLPLAAGRMASMTGKELSTPYFCTAGALMTSSGFVDAILYAFTRRVITLSDEPQASWSLDGIRNQGPASHPKGFAVSRCEFSARVSTDESIFKEARLDSPTFIKVDSTFTVIRESFPPATQAGILDGSSSRAI
ncbi:hypothetical protein FGG08_002648 [Glutinoglossum americanum]|uniref:G protein-coupled receptor GPR1/2/3 C-terminal domain-containing protein n=1 Tax=Glutinoglossum americanum TaxID=1670608 RepID=A0A9P8L1H4_9PEZI|nr:hypothetical protein FGG08_002648 [Glutinoglossum americanum]